VQLAAKRRVGRLSYSQLNSGERNVLKVLLNTTTRPVGFDYAKALEESGALGCFVSAFPRWNSADLVPLLGGKARFHDFWQIIFLVSNRLAGSTRFSRFLSHCAKVSLDRATCRYLANADAAIFYSGAGLETTRASRRRGKLSVCQVHHAHVLEQEDILRKEASASGLRYTPIYSPAQVQRQLQEFEEVDVIVCPSGAVRESFKRNGVPASKLLVVPHGVDLSAGAGEKKRASKPAKPLRVLYVGQQHYRKGLRYLAEALQGLASDQVECRVVGPDFGLSGLAAAPGAERFVRTGPKKGSDLLAEYAEADVFVLPSLEEGFGLVVLEAMRAGLPVIITSAVGAKDFVTDGIEGWVVPPADPHALREKIQWMQWHPAERQAMGRAAAERAQSAGGWTASARRLVEALSQKNKELKQGENK
jgi:glycosyltransferase involved in cell wall biosynthesis